MNTSFLDLTWVVKMDADLHRAVKKAFETFWSPAWLLYNEDKNKPRNDAACYKLQEKGYYILDNIMQTIFRSFRRKGRLEEEIRNLNNRLHPLIIGYRPHP